MAEYYYYCPYCGKMQIRTNSGCTGCVQKISPIKSKHDVNYYREKSLNIYGDFSHWQDVLTEEEISKNPLYDQLKVNESQERQKKTQERILQNIFDEHNSINQSQPNIPKCPTCQSTNIKKISTTNRLISVATLGLASSKIGKQFECKNCGYKW